MNFCRKLMSDCRFWMVVGLLSGVLNIMLCFMSFHYRSEILGEINSITIKWYKSDPQSVPTVDYPAQCDD